MISAVNDINRQNDELSNIISNILETACKKEDIIPVSDKIDTFASIMSSLKELISDTKEEIGLMMIRTEQDGEKEEVTE